MSSFSYAHIEGSGGEGKLLCYSLIGQHAVKLLPPCPFKSNFAGIKKILLLDN